LAEGVRRFLGTTKGTKASSVFAGVAATGVGVDDLGLDVIARAMLKEKVITATRRILKTSDVSAVCVGGVILAGTEHWIREACILELGAEMGESVRIIDQMHAGVMTLDGLVRIAA